MPRILTLTLNPAVDIACFADHVVPQHKVRTHGQHSDPGGGGVNVARVLRELGADTCAVVLAGGISGRILQTMIEAEGVPCRVVPTAGDTRISMTVNDEASGLEYRFVPEGPLVSGEELAAILAVLGEERADWLVISGSLPRGIAPAALGQIVRTAVARGMQVAVDTSGEALRATLGQGLALIKPSLREFEDLLGATLSEDSAQEAAAMRLVREGAAARVAVSLGAGGAILATAEGVVRIPALPVKVVGTVGAGDSFVAAMVLALSRGATPAEALAWGAAAGTAAVASTGTARPKRADMEALFAQAKTLL